jgi:hypothetical protein
MVRGGGACVKKADSKTAEGASAGNGEEEVRELEATSRIGQVVARNPAGRGTESNQTEGLRCVENKFPEHEDHLVKRTG